MKVKDSNKIQVLAQIGRLFAACEGKLHFADEKRSLIMSMVRLATIRFFQTPQATFRNGWAKRIGICRGHAL
jgi:hypothetical protein